MCPVAQCMLKMASKWVLLVVVAVGLVVIGGYLLLPSPSQSLEEGEEIKPIIEPIEEEVEEQEEWVGGEFEINTKLPFKPGDRFEYRSICDDSDYTGVYEVDEIERINGEEYYSFLVDGWGKFMDEWGRWLDQGTKGDPTKWLYYNKETGEAYEIDSLTEELVRLDDFTGRGLPLYNWMLALDDDFAIEPEYHYSDGRGFTSKAKFVYKVVGRENLRGRECFKVENRVIDIDTNKVEERKYYWVDVETRVWIKSVWYQDNVKVCETNLVSAPFPLEALGS